MREEEKEGEEDKVLSFHTTSFTSCDACILCDDGTFCEDVGESCLQVNTK